MGSHVNRQIGALSTSAEAERGSVTDLQREKPVKNKRGEKAAAAAAATMARAKLTAPVLPPLFLSLSLCALKAVVSLARFLVSLSLTLFLSQSLSEGPWP